jgi:hypothetical protein
MGPSVGGVLEVLLPDGIESEISPAQPVSRGASELSWNSAVSR